MDHNPEECSVCACRAGDKAIRPYVDAVMSALTDELHRMFRGDAPMTCRRCHLTPPPIVTHAADDFSFLEECE